MKKILFFAFVFLGVFALGINDSSATVGGSTLISRIVYDADNNSLYYLENDNGGRGCPPVIKKVDLAKNSIYEVMTCDQIEGEYYKDRNLSLTEYYKFIEATIGKFPEIPSVNLKKNNIIVEIGFIKEVIESDVFSWTDFQAVIKQDGQKKETIEFRGCARDQANIIEGFKIPDSDKMALMFSRKGDCFEGGYIKEDIYLISGINYYDSNPVRLSKDNTELNMNEGNLVEYARIATPTPTTSIEIENQDENDSIKNNLFYIILGAILFFLIAIIIGYALGRRS